jgi:nitrate reductase gamma subunit
MYENLYEFMCGPLAWVAFVVCFLGIFYRLGSMLWMAKKDRVIYPYLSVKYSFRSLLHWVTPFGSRNMRLQPGMTILSFVFHVCIILTPLFLMPHIILIQLSWKISWWALPKSVADVFTLIVIIACVIFLIRRATNPTVRFVSYVSDYVILALAFLPFFTGFLACHHLLPYKMMSLLHILCGEIMLMAIPFTRLSHMLFFPFTRAYMGSEFGAVRNARDW